MSNNNNEDLDQSSKLYQGVSMLVMAALFVIVLIVVSSADAGGSVMAMAGESGMIPQFSIGIGGFVRLLFNLGIALVVLSLVATLGGIAKIVQIMLGMMFDLFAAVARLFQASSPTSRGESPSIVTIEARLARLEAKTASIPDPPKPLTPEQELVKLKAELAKLKAGAPTQ